MIKRQQRESIFPLSHDKATKRMRRVLKLAEDEARRFHHAYVGTEHILLGLIDEGEGVAAIVLQRLAGDLTAIRGAVEAIVRPGESTVDGAELVPTTRARRAMDLAEHEARTLGHHYLGTEHALLGLVEEGEGIAAGVLHSLGIDLEGARRAVISALAGLGADEPPATKGYVLTCRVDARDLDAIDALVESGVRATRSNAASWLIHAGVEANRDLLERVYGTVAEIRRLREEISWTRNVDATAELDQSTEANQS